MSKKNIMAVAGLVMASASVIILTAGHAAAFEYGTNITIADGITSSAYDGKTYTAIGTGTGGENNEAEPHMVQSQAWDLEGFFLNGKSLSIIGGYNFYTGQEGMKAGDIFIDTNGDAIRSPNTITNHVYKPNEELTNSFFNYDYVLHINWTSSTFDIVKLNNNSLLKNTVYGSAYNQPSNPWLYLSGGTIVNGTTPLSFNNHGKSTQSDTGFSNWDGGGPDTHFAATFDISAIDISNGALFHNTMECGNDNLMGQSAPVPEPGTMALLGFGMLGLAVFGKRHMGKNA